MLFFVTYILYLNIFLTRPRHAAIIGIETARGERMAFFSTGMTLNKLNILFFMRALGLPMTPQQFVELDAREGWMGYFNLREALADLVESGLLNSIPSVLGESYVLNESGAETLKQFEKRIPDSQRSMLDHTAKENREALLIQRQYSSTLKKEAPLEYKVELKAYENEKAMFELAFMVTSREAAQRVCDEWSAKAPGVYHSVVMLLQS